MKQPSNKRFEATAEMIRQATKGSVFQFIKEYVLMAVGMFIYAFGWIGCILPQKGVGGGASGLSILICSALENGFGISIEIGTMVFIINAVLLIIAGFVVGWKFGIKSIYCIVVLSVAMNTWQSVLQGQDIMHLERFLSIILGGVCAGIGVAICFKQGGSTGGTDIVAMMINKYRTISYGKIVIYSDFIIIGSAAIFGYGVDTIIYGYVFTGVFGYTVDLLMSGNQQSSQIFIITPDYETMADAIMSSAHRGVTLLDSQGWYTKENSKVVMVVCRKREFNQIIKVVKIVDPNAFITVGSVMGVYGQGFEAINKL